MMTIDSLIEMLEEQRESLPQGGDTEVVVAGMDGLIVPINLISADMVGTLGSDDYIPETDQFVVVEY